MEEDFRIAMDQRRAEALARADAERVRHVEWVQRSREETTLQCRAELAAAEETARRMIAAAQARVAELADVRGRIAAQLRGTQAQLGTALDELAPQVPAAPRHRPSAPRPGSRGRGPRRTGVVAAPEAPPWPPRPSPGTPRRRRVDGAPASPVEASTPEPVTRPPHRPSDREPSSWTRRRHDTAPDEPGPRTGDDRPPTNGSSAVAAGEDAETVPTLRVGEVRRPTQRRRKRQTAPRAARATAQRRPPGLRCRRCAQHPVCQCRRSSTDPWSPAGHVTRCPVPAVMSWSQPGQR